MKRLAQRNRVMAAALADLEADIRSGVERPVIHARAHLASLSPERRAQLEREWEGK
jgi:hypothetical protein